MQYLLSPTLLNAYDFLRTCPPTWKKSAREGLEATLYRAPFTTTPEIEKGFVFEKAVEDCCTHNKNYNGASDAFRQVVDMCQGGKFQQWLPTYYLPVTYNDKEIKVKLSGKIDVEFPDKLLDLKTTLKFNEKKYLSGWQHHVYCAATEKNSFTYVIAVWESTKSFKIANVHTVGGTFDKAESEALLQKEVVSFFDFLHKENLWEAYLKLYCKNKG